MDNACHVGVIIHKAVIKWTKWMAVADMPGGPKDPKSIVLTLEEEPVIIAFKEHTLQLLDDLFYPLQTPQKALALR